MERSELMLRFKHPRPRNLLLPQSSTDTHHPRTPLPPPLRIHPAYFLVITRYLPPRKTAITTLTPSLRFANPPPPKGQTNIIKNLSTSETTPPPRPYTTASVTLTTTLHIASAFYAYAKYTATGQTAFALGMLGSGALACMGGWCLMFGGESKVRRSGWLTRGQRKRR